MSESSPAHFGLHGQTLSETSPLTCGCVARRTGIAKPGGYDPAMPRYQVEVGQALLLCDTAARTLGVHLGFVRGVVPRAVTVVSIPTA